jgi:hypothetical protein
MFCRSCSSGRCREREKERADWLALHFVATMVAWQHFGYSKYKVQEASVKVRCGWCGCELAALGHHQAAPAQ